FFFQAEDGIRDFHVTGVQTCALPISSSTGTSATLEVATTTLAGVMSAADKTKLDGIEAGAQVNVKSDWNAVSGDAQILNKPTIPTKTSQLENDSGFITDADIPTQDLQSVMESGSSAVIIDPLNPRLEEEWGYFIYGSDGVYQNYFYKPNSYSSADKNSV